MIKAPMIKAILGKMVEPIAGLDNWILLTGFWDDEGLWVDSDTWNSGT